MQMQKQALTNSVAASITFLASHPCSSASSTCQAEEQHRCGPALHAQLSQRLLLVLFVSQPLCWLPLTTCACQHANQSQHLLIQHSATAAIVTLLTTLREQTQGDQYKQNSKFQKAQHELDVAIASIFHGICCKLTITNSNADCCRKLMHQSCQFWSGAWSNEHMQLWKRLQENQQVWIMTLSSLSRSQETQHQSCKCILASHAAIL